MRPLIDLHSHLLPGVDDGPSDDAGALAMARAAEAAGIRAMAATPHVDHKHGVDLDALPGRLDDLRRRLSEAGVPLEVHQGGELTATRLTEMDADELRAVSLGGGPYLLLECPFTAAGGLFGHVVYRAQSMGFGVLLAHPERSAQFLGHPDRLAELVQRGALVQVTASSLSGAFGRTVQQAAVEMLAAGLVHVIASDAHDDRGRPPELMAPIAAATPLLRGLDEHAPYFTQIVPEAILNGGDVPPPPELKPRRGKVLAARLRRRR